PAPPAGTDDHAGPWGRGGALGSRDRRPQGAARGLVLVAPVAFGPPPAVEAERRAERHGDFRGPEEPLAPRPRAPAAADVHRHHGGAALAGQHARARPRRPAPPLRAPGPLAADQPR